jgi:hypothetical protein
MSPGKFVYTIMDLKNAKLPDAEFKDLIEKHITEVLNEIQKEGKLVDFLTSATNNGFPIILAVAYNCELRFVAEIMNRAKVLDPSVFSKILTVKYKDKNLMEVLGSKRAAELLSLLNGIPVSSKIITPTAPSDKEEKANPLEEPINPPTAYGRGGKAAVLLDKNGTNFKFLPPPAEIRRIEAGLSHNSIRLQDFQDFIAHQVNRGELDLPDKLSVSQGNKLLKKAIEQAKEILGVYKKGKNQTGFTPRELLFLKRLEKYCYISPDGLLFSIKKYKWLKSQRNFKQIVMDLFK